jgi:hypothetical protein
VECKGLRVVDNESDEHQGVGSCLDRVIEGSRSAKAVQSEQEMEEEYEGRLAEALAALRVEWHKVDQFGSSRVQYGLDAIARGRGSTSCA